MEDDPVRFGPRARWTRMNLRWSEELGCRWVGRGGSYDVFKALHRLLIALAWGLGVVGGLVFLAAVLSRIL